VLAPCRLSQRSFTRTETIPMSSRRSQSGHLARTIANVARTTPQSTGKIRRCIPAHQHGQCLRATTTSRLGRALGSFGFASKGMNDPQPTKATQVGRQVTSSRTTSTSRRSKPQVLLASQSQSQVLLLSQRQSTIVAMFGFPG